MNRRERVISALEHRPCDQIPYHFDFTQNSFQRTAEYFHDPDFYDKMGCCLFYQQYCGYPAEMPDRPHFYKDDFGVIWNRTIDKDIGVVQEPFVCDLDDYKFPHVELDEARLRAEYKQMQAEKGDRFTFYGIGFSMFERAWSLCGMENVLIAMLTNPEALDQLLDDICEYDLKIIRIAMEYDIDGFYFGDDWGQQKGLIMGEKLWRRFIRPRMARLYAEVKKHGKFVIQHSCGDIYTLFQDLLDIGLNCYQTFQPEIYDVRKVKQEYGSRLAFWGGISVQQLLPFGTPEQVAEETRRMLRIMSENGGYIAAPTHAVPGDVPPENIEAMLNVLQNQ